MLSQLPENNEAAADEVGLEIASREGPYILPLWGSFKGIHKGTIRDL